MESIYELITLGVQNEHDLEHDPEHEKLFSNPKIYDAEGDLSKRWYVYFSYKDLKTGRLKRMKNIYGKANRYKTKEARYSLLGLYRKRLLKLLEAGYDPFSDNSALLAKNQNLPKTESKPVRVKAVPIEIPEVKIEEPTKPTEEANLMSVKEAIDFALKLKTNIVSPRTLRDYEGYCNLFQKWVLKNHPQIVAIVHIDKKVVTEFLNSIQLKTSPRNRNNYRTSLSTIF